MLLDFGPGDMEVYADFIPAISKGMPLNLEYAKTLLERLNVVHGVFWERIEATLKQCNETGKALKKVLIARGDIPVDEVAAYFKLEESARKPAQPRFEAAEQTNYRAFSPFIIVNKGDVLAVRREAVEGVMGRTVHGAVVGFGKSAPPSVMPGKNTYQMSGKIFAEVDGHLVIDKNVLNVESTLVIRGAVGYATGDINFPGDVHLEGPVNEGFKINAGGSLFVRDTLDVTDVLVRGDMSVKGGMIGRGRALVKVSGKLSARFIQNCRLACKGRIDVATELINSTVYAMDSLVMSDKGTILGGEIFAFHSITAGRIGTSNSNPAKLYVGADWTLRQDIENNKNLLRLILAKIDQVKAYLNVPAMPEAKRAKVLEMQSRLSEELEKATRKQTELDKRALVDSAAVVKCTGDIAAGTVISIYGLEFVAETPLRRVSIEYSKETRRIVPISLS
ncbi:MAG: FapA family protein [Spirochaetaceae bacterium]|jgi:uncharacterized protein (DUF342 family)|nr:FapA family protein [Spirochaetaceae bacterium]